MKETTNDAANRREFMKRVAALTVSASAFGLGASVAQAAKNVPVVEEPVVGGRALSEEQVKKLRGHQRAMANVMNQALATGNMAGAMELYGKKLAPKGRAALLKITDLDLAQINKMMDRIKFDESLVGLAGGFLF